MNTVVRMACKLLATLLQLAAIVLFLHVIVPSTHVPILPDNLAGSALLVSIESDSE
jgi:hypothetical protein